MVPGVADAALQFEHPEKYDTKAQRRPHFLLRAVVVVGNSTIIVIRCAVVVVSTGASRGSSNKKAHQEGKNGQEGQSVSSSNHLISFQNSCSVMISDPSLINLS